MTHKILIMTNLFNVDLTKKKEVSFRLARLFAYIKTLQSEF